MNHFATVWTSPRATIRAPLDEDAVNPFLLLAATYGIVDNLHSILEHEIDPATGATMPGVLLRNIVFGSLSGIVLFIVFSYVLPGVGRFFGGKPSARAARTVLTWAAVPYLPLLVVIIPFTFFAGDALIFHSQLDVFRGVAGTSVQVVSLVYFFGRVVMTIWSIVIAVIGLSEAFGISTVRSLLVFLIAGIVLGLVIVGAILLLGTIGIL